MYQIHGFVNFFSEAQNDNLLQTSEEYPNHT